MSPVGVVLGSGLGAFADTLENRLETPYSDIAGWPPSTAVGPRGQAGDRAGWAKSKWSCSPAARITTKATRRSR